MKSDVLFHIPDMYARWVFCLSRVDFFPSTFSVTFTRALCPTWCMSVKLWKVWAWAMVVAGSGFSASLSMQHEAEWLKLCCFASAATLWWSPAQPEAEVRQLCYIIIMCMMSCSSRHDFCNRQKVHAIISLNDQGYGFELCRNVV